MCFLQAGTPEGLRGLRKPQGSAIDGPLDHAAGPHIFHRIAHRECNDRSPMLRRGINDPANHLGRQKRPDGIVHEDDVRLIDFGQRMANRILSLRSSGHNLGDFAEFPRRDEMIETILAFRLRHGQNNLMNNRGSLEDVKRLRKDRPATQGEKLLGNSPPHAEPPTSRRNEGHCSQSRR